MASLEQVLIDRVDRLPGLSESALAGTGPLKLAGVEKLKSFIAATLVGEHTHKLDVRNLETMQQQLLQHSLRVAIATQMIASDLKYADPSTAFTAGLFHDVGEAILNAFAYDEIAESLKLTQAKAVEAWVAEDRRLGFNHAYFGAKVLERMGMRAEIVACVRHHHHPTTPLTSMLHVADVAVLCHATKLPLGIKLFPLDEEALARLGLTKERLATYPVKAAQVVEALG